MNFIVWSELRYFKQFWDDDEIISSKQNMVLNKAEKFT